MSRQLRAAKAFSVAEQNFKVRSPWLVNWLLTPIVSPLPTFKSENSHHSLSQSGHSFFGELLHFAPIPPSRRFGATGVVPAGPPWNASPTRCGHRRPPVCAPLASGLGGWRRVRSTGLDESVRPGRFQRLRCFPRPTAQSVQDAERLAKEIANYKAARRLGFDVQS